MVALFTMNCAPEWNSLQAAEAREKGLGVYTGDALFRKSLLPCLSSNKEIVAMSF